MGYIKLNTVSKTYIKQKNKVEALNKISLDFEKKGMYFITGYSGSGKTTLLNVIGGLIDFDSGDVLIDNKSLKDFDKTQLNNYYKQEIGLLFQEVNHIKTLTVMKNIQLGLSAELKDDEKILNVGKSIGLDSDLFLRKIEELSMGQKQRAALTRILVKNPNVILADEPTASLDEKTGRKLMTILKEISKEKLVIVVSHDMNLTKEFADVIYNLENGFLVPNEIDIPNRLNRIIDSSKALSKVDENKHDLLNLRDVVSLSIFYSMTNKTRYFISTILLSISLILIFSMMSLFNYNIDSAIHRYLVQEDIEWVIPYIHEEKDIGYGEIEENNVFNGLGVYNLLDIENDEINKMYINQSISLFDDETPEGETKQYKTNVISYSNLSIEIIGEYPSLQSEIIVSDYLYDEIFSSQVQLPINVFLNGVEVTITGIITRDNLPLKLSDFDNEYNNEFVKYNVFINDSLEYEKPYIILQDTTNEGVDIYAKYSEYTDYLSGVLNPGEIAITSEIATRMNLVVGDYMTFRDPISSSEINLNNIFNENMRVVEIINSSETTIILANDDYDLLIEQYNNYFYFDYFLVKPNNIYSSIESIYTVGGYYEPGTELILEQTDFILRVQTLFYPLLAVCMVITMLSVLNLITSLLNKRGNEFGLMRSYGIKDKKLYLIFILQAISMFVVSLLVSSLVVYQWIRYLNKTLTIQLISNFSFIQVSNSNIIIMIGILSCFIVTMTVILCHNYLRKSIFENIYK